MSKNVFNINENYRRNLKEEIRMVSDCASSKLHGEVSIFEKRKSGNLKLIEKPNMIVFSGREWLVERAFGDVITDYSAEKSSYAINCFGIGVGGGEPGNPLQAGATIPNDTDLSQPVRMRSDLVSTDPGYEMYTSRTIDGEAAPVYGYYKRFSSVIKKQDHANPYVVSGNTLFPSLIAEVRIELSSDDCNQPDSYQDINEAALYCSNPLLVDPGTADEGESSSSSSTLEYDIINVVKDPNSYNTLYRLDTEDIDTSIKVGDTLWVDGTSDHNLIAQAMPLLIIDIYRGEVGVNGYVIVEKADAENETPAASAMEAHFIESTVSNYIMFSRITFSSLRKTQDREIVFLWKIYF